jgi:ABC-type multidrug transport system permease subunit
MNHPLYQLTLARTRELFREPEALFWVFVFPLILALALGLAFRNRAPEEIPVGVQQGPEASFVMQALESAPGLRPILLDAEGARQRLRSGKVMVVVRTSDPWTFWLDPTRPESRQARLLTEDALQRAAGRVDPRASAELEMTEKGSRYIDFLIPGLLGMNLMGTGIWGIGFNIVQVRSKRLLKRLVATPMKRSHFLLSQILGRLVFLGPEVALLVGFGALVFDVPVHGSWLALAVASLIGAFTFSGIGLLVASRAKTIEGVSGLMNLVMMPMWLGSGVFFSTDRFPEILQPAIQLLPLTALVDALRGVMLDGASLMAVSGDLLISGAWGALTFGAALLLFRWS